MKEKIRSKHHPIKELIAALEDVAALTQVHGIFFGPITSPVQAEAALY